MLTVKDAAGLNE